jgi:hypothetical protein
MKTLIQDNLAEIRNKDVRNASSGHVFFNVVSRHLLGGNEETTKNL